MSTSAKCETYEIFLDTEDLTMPVGELVVSRGDMPSYVPPFQFTYADSYLAEAKAFALSPDMPLARDVYRSRSVDREMLGAFADCLPDRWGRRLIERKLGQSHLPDIDYLLNVPDFSRQGALRISGDGGRTFLGSDFVYGGVSGLRGIHQAIENFTAGTATGDEIERILLTGSQSNGGQFPKTALIDDEGDLCIAKFQGDAQLASPHWEAVCLSLARDAGIEVPAFKHLWLDDISVLIEKRFDRVPLQAHQAHDVHRQHRTGQSRIPFISAESFMSLPSNPTYVTPYSVFAQRLHRRIGPAEAQKLFDRVAFLLLVNNTDDHWKNHGLLYSGGTWQLAPLFDVNPTTSPDPYNLPQITQRSEVKRSVATLIEDAASYALNRQQAVAAVERIASVVRTWRSYAERYVRSEQEIEVRAGAFVVRP
jgi:serine/threonine-protein kinase HipA